MYMFAYCKNNFVNVSDFDGDRPAFDSSDDEEAYYEWLHQQKPSNTSSSAIMTMPKTRDFKPLNDEFLKA